MRRAHTARGSMVWALGALPLLWVACGGQAVIDGDSGSGGGSSSSSSSSMGPVTSGSPTSSSSGPAPTTCESVCNDLFGCMLENNNCPGVTASDQTAFVSGCVPSCEQNPVLTALVDPSDCMGTVTVLMGANPDFADTCQNGL